MNMIKTVFDVARIALNEHPKYVTIDRDNVEKLIKEMLIRGRPTPFVSQQGDINQRLFILKELIACSINYCYWYGSSDIRPNDTSSTLMYMLVDEAFDPTKIEDDFCKFENRMEYLIELLAVNRFPLLEDRVRHLRELERHKVNQFITNIILSEKISPELMVKKFPGFGSDIFLKRLSLFFIQLYRKYGWFAADKNDLMYILPVPADYQLPKILNYFGCIKYKPSLEEKIWENKLIQKHSLEEIQIRAATIQVCNNLLLGLDGWTIADIDTWLWTKRKMTDMPFHCTITTDY